MLMMIFTTLFFFGIFIMFVFILFGQEKLIKQVNKELETLRAQLVILENHFVERGVYSPTRRAESQDRVSDEKMRDTAKERHSSPLQQPSQIIVPPAPSPASTSTASSAQAASSAMASGSAQASPVFSFKKKPRAANHKQKPPTPPVHDSTFGGVDLRGVGFGEAPNLASQTDLPPTQAKEFPSPMTEAYNVRKSNVHSSQNSQLPNTGHPRGDKERLNPNSHTHNAHAQGNSNNSPQNLELFMPPPKKR